MHKGLGLSTLVRVPTGQSCILSGKYLRPLTESLRLKEGSDDGLVVYIVALKHTGNLCRKQPGAAISSATDTILCV